ncbi:hypothetical protein QU481_04980 [Crenobacter sp. SG2303]|uniref:Uncharacterized protein n=1 Tax=Crenobacter oryzisoli TaxID=3056844 RepID=A0ABT7XKL2_9NEIS|nr:hypothetical protein [Crenobacter sp. SG2303]MDN0074243.1 hypothetical protein [Crenobacter sp. SG2303]
MRRPQGVYDASGNLQSASSFNYVPGDTNANWAQIIQADPSLASDAAGFELQQGIVSTLA